MEQFLYNLKPICWNAEIPIPNQFPTTIPNIPKQLYVSFLEEKKQSILISDVKILSPNKVVQVIFADGTSEKAVCDKEDTFSLETGITVCIAKKLLGGTKEYNKTIRNALKAMERKEKDRKDREERNKRIELKRQKEVEKRRERKIKIQEEAYYRAMKRVETEKKG